MNTLPPKGVDLAGVNREMITEGDGQGEWVSESDNRRAIDGRFQRRWTVGALGKRGFHAKGSAPWDVR